MRYAQIRSLDISNGEDVGVSLFVQGCPFHCYGCFNPETWDFNSGKEWTDVTEKSFLELINRPYIKRVSFLGGSPLCNNNIIETSVLIKKVKDKFPDKNIWVYTGFTWENLTELELDDISINKARNVILNNIDVLVDGRFEYDKKDFSLLYRGSTNQRIIDVKKSLESGEIVLWNSSKQ